MPFCEEALAENRGLAGADLVPYQLNYPVLRVKHADPDGALPAPGEAQVIAPEDWPGRRRRPEETDAAA